MLRPPALTRRAISANVGERPALLCGGPGDLLRDHRDADAAPPRGVQAVLHGHVVVGDDRLDLDASPSQVRGHVEVHDVAGVVLDDVQHAAPPLTALVASSIWSASAR